MTSSHLPALKDTVMLLSPGTQIAPPFREGKSTGTIEPLPEMKARAALKRTYSVSGQPLVVRRESAKTIPVLDR